MFCFFFFKQKTAYEMRISDWSSDVCSSDLEKNRQLYKKRRDVLVESFGRAGWDIPPSRASMFCWAPLPPAVAHLGSLEFSKQLLRSEEHTSELQSLMRISYAVFCLKKKNNNSNKIIHTKMTYVTYLSNSYEKIVADSEQRV